MAPRPLLYLLVFVLGLLPGASTWAESGVSDNEIRIGMINAQSGPAAGLGAGMKDGVQAYFARVNADGGVNGRKISLVAKDDTYEPARTAALTEALITNDNVFALLGYVGTPTSRAAIPIASSAQVPYLFPFTGAEFLSTPLKKWVFSLRASYFEETEEMLERMHKDLGLNKIAILMQDDSFGESVKSGLAGALSKRGMRIHAEARILRNSLNVKAAVAALKQAEPQAIVFIGTYQQLAAAIKQAKAVGLNAHFFTVSFIGTENFISAAGADSEGVYITQVVPSPDNSELPIIQQYRSDIAPHAVGYASLEGYLAAKTFTIALAATGQAPTRTELVEELQYLQTDLGGFLVAFSPNNHRGSKAVFLTRVENGKAVPVNQMR